MLKEDKSHRDINKLLGEKLSPEKMSEILSKLKFKTEIQGNNLSIKVPEFRLDIDMEADIVEEIARLYGYNNIFLIKKGMK